MWHLYRPFFLPVSVERPMQFYGRAANLSPEESQQRMTHSHPNFAGENLWPMN